ncbi:hypothetical protein KY349_00740 [Candidatus Woesearchaeota archaeon]|nr:hypothetical protein [Candidatus Woesearchaeota archaeon]
MDEISTALTGTIFSLLGLYVLVEYRDRRQKKSKLKDAAKFLEEGRLGEAYRKAHDLRRSYPLIQHEAKNICKTIEDRLTPDINAEINAAKAKLAKMDIKIVHNHDLMHSAQYMFVDRKGQHLRLEDISPTYKKYFGSRDYNHDTR